MEEIFSNTFVRDRVQLLEPQLRDTLQAVRVLRSKALDECFQNLLWSEFSSAESNRVYLHWCWLSSRYRARHLECVSAVLRDGAFPDRVKTQANQLWADFDSNETEFDRGCLKVARELQPIVKASNPRLKQLGKSAADTARAVILLTSRIQVVKDHPPTLREVS